MIIFVRSCRTGRSPYLSRLLSEMRNTDRRRIALLTGVVLVIIVAGIVMVRSNQQPRITPASSTGSMQEQLSPQKNPTH